MISYYKNKILKKLKKMVYCKRCSCTYLPNLTHICFWFIWKTKGSVTALWRNVTIFKLMYYFVFITQVCIISNVQNSLNCIVFLSCSFYLPLFCSLGFPGGLAKNNSPVSAGDTGLRPGLGRFPGEGNGNSLLHSRLENPMPRGTWRL